MDSKNKGGRPKKEIDLVTVEKLATIQCTQEEIAQFLGVSIRTLQRNKEFCRVYKKGLDSGRMSLRRLQWKAAERGNTPALIWLGKQYLSQSENPQELMLKREELEHKRYIDTERLELEKRKLSGDLDKDDELIDDWVSAVTDDEE